MVRLYYRLASQVEGKYDTYTRGKRYPRGKDLCCLLLVQSYRGLCAGKVHSTSPTSGPLSMLFSPLGWCEPQINAGSCFRSPLNAIEWGRPSVTIWFKITKPSPNTVPSHLSLFHFSHIALIIIQHITHFTYIVCLPHYNLSCIRTGIPVYFVHYFISSMNSVITCSKNEY